MYRDDLGAANARVSALEAELRQVKESSQEGDRKAAERIAALERKLAAAQKKAEAKTAAKADPPRGGRRTYTPWLRRVSTPVVMAVLVLIAGATVWYMVLGAQRAQTAFNSPGFEDAYRLQMTGGERLLVLERSSNVSGHRFSLLDPATGKTDAQVRIGPTEELLGRVGDALWFSVDSQPMGLVRRDLPGLKPSFTLAALSKQMGQVHLIKRPLGPLGFALLADDGRHYWLDATTLQVTLASSAPDADSARFAEGMLATGSYSSVAQVKLAGGATARWVGDNRKALDCGDGPSAETLLDPYFVVAEAEGGQLWQGQPTSLLVTHRERLSATTLQLSNVPCQGAPLWTLPLAMDKIHVALVSGRLLVMILHRDKDRRDALVGIDLADGHERFRKWR